MIVISSSPADLDRQQKIIEVKTHDEYAKATYLSPRVWDYSEMF